MFKPATVTIEQVAGQSTTDESAARLVFRVLHGFYGNLFSAKFASGKLHKETGADLGVASARTVWAIALQRFDAATVTTALDRCAEAHSEFPPSLPQFLVLCAAAAPRGKVADASKLLGMAPALRSQYARQARDIIARRGQKAQQKAAGHVEPPPATLAGLKQAIADAVGCAGGDEAAELLRLDRMLGVPA
jgi:hypothetical protein